MHVYMYVRVCVQMRANLLLTALRHQCHSVEEMTEFIENRELKLRKDLPQYKFTNDDEAFVLQDELLSMYEDVKTDALHKGGFSENGQWDDELLVYSETSWHVSDANFWRDAVDSHKGGLYLVDLEQFSEPNQEKLAARKAELSAQWAKWSGEYERRLSQVEEICRLERLARWQKARVLAGESVALTPAQNVRYHSPNMDAFLDTDEGRITLWKLNLASCVLKTVYRKRYDDYAAELFRQQRDDEDVKIKGEDEDEGEDGMMHVDPQAEKEFDEIHAKKTEDAAYEAQPGDDKRTHCIGCLKITDRTGVVRKFRCCGYEMCEECFSKRLMKKVGDMYQCPHCHVVHDLDNSSAKKHYNV